MTGADLAAGTGLSWDTVKDIVKAHLESTHGHPRLKELRRLSIDELYVGRQKKFYPLGIALDSGRIVWVARGRGADALRRFWRALRLAKAKIEAVAMAMSAAYWAAGAEHLPDAAVVFDRFHLVKLVNEKLDDLRRALGREATGLMKRTVKGLRYLLLMRRENVAEERLPQLEEALRHNEPLSLGYRLKEALGLLWEQPSRAHMQPSRKRGVSGRKTPACGRCSWLPRRSNFMPGAFWRGGTIGSATGAWQASTTRFEPSCARPMACATSATSNSASIVSMRPDSNSSDEPAVHVTRGGCAPQLRPTALESGRGRPHSTTLRIYSCAR